GNDRLGVTFCRLLRDQYGDRDRANSLMKCYLKTRTREELRAAGVDDLPAYPIHDLAGLETAVAHLADYPSWVLKPAFGTASELVRPDLRGEASVRAAYARVSSKARTCGD